MSSSSILFAAAKWIPTLCSVACGGTVSTYDLDSDGIASMLAGDLMPRPPAVLASVISVTYIGRGNLPKNWLRSTFRVRRKAVSDALCWLKENNPKYYGHIKIDSSRLAALLEDDVPLAVTSLVRQSTDTGIVDRESTGYVTRRILFGIVTSSVDNNEVPQNSTWSEASDEPDVIPLDITGTVDTDLSKLSTNEMMIWGLQNMWKENKEGAYAVCHGRRPVNDFGKPRASDPEPADPDRPNFLNRHFRVSFPYGKGGLEADRRVELSFGDHIKWALQYHDLRFRRHETFPFVAFGISQCRQALMSARIQMRRKNFERDARLMTTITPEKLQQACREEEQKLPISDPAVRLLRQHVHSTVARVKGSNQSRTVMRSQLWSTAAYISPWNLWITINPTDIHDPIAQIFASENIDLDDFIAGLGPDNKKRARNIAADPYAAAKFFYFMIRTILETLFGIEVTSFQVRSSLGILGEVAAYFGMVEAQNHSFRARVSASIKANLRAHPPGLETAESVKGIPMEKDIAYNRPPNPAAPDYDQQIQRWELRLARTEQVDTCKIRRCLVVSKSGQLRCKRRAPFACFKEDFIDESGNWGPKRVYEFMNGWMPGILVNVRCNNDIKLLTNGRDTVNMTYYVAGYAIKPQKLVYNVSAIFAKGYAYHLAQLDRERAQEVDEIRDQQRLLLFRLVHTINREQELGAPMVISYLMGWGDSYRSHHYTPIYWSLFVGALLKAFPGLRNSRSKSAVAVSERAPDNAETRQEDEADIETDERARDAAAEETEAQQAEDGNEILTLRAASRGMSTNIAQLHKSDLETPI
ncbi:ATP-dependent DNA helicase [Mycena venus]|uniref:ATP-dependent DNA helicase n=1 Tax=Mycena venus TaxID=2733690 RepID=A0A8H6XYL8_9AGAR|nr:ATP-dependent DNA helicase [Mycena venus]